MVPSTPVADLGPLGLDSGGHVLLSLALQELAPGDIVEVVGQAGDLVPMIRAWSTANGHRFTTERPPGWPIAEFPRAVGYLERGPHAEARWVGASAAGESKPGVVVDHAPPEWGLVSRGVWIEAGGPQPHFALSAKTTLWSDDVARLYDRALAGQWDPATAVPWDAARSNEPEVERAVVQVMGYLVENEEAALVVPARFLGQIHPHFAEVQHILAATIADEARHAHTFARRARLSEVGPSLSGAGGRASLQTLLDEPDFATASFLLSVLGEGSFLSLLGFLERHGPDECTRSIARLVRADEARHVAFGLAHLERHCSLEPDLRPRLARAVERRHDDLRNTAGLNQSVFDSLVILAGGGTTPEAIGAGWKAVQELQVDMQTGRESRLARLGFSSGESQALASLHTRNFM